MVAQKSSRSYVLRLVLDLPVVADDGEAALFAEGRVGEDHVERLRWAGGEGVVDVDGAVVAVVADAVQVEVHDAEADDAGDDLAAAQGVVAEVVPLVLVERCGRWLADVVVGGEEEAAGAAGGVADGLRRAGAA